VGSQKDYGIWHRDRKLSTSKTRVDSLDVYIEFTPGSQTCHHSLPGFFQSTARDRASDMAEGPRGWQQDPFKVHELRYIAMNGIATRLVSDQGIRSYDPPPQNDPLAYSAGPSTSTSKWTPSPPPSPCPSPAPPLANEPAHQEAREQTSNDPSLTWSERPPPSEPWAAASAPPPAVNTYEAPPASPKASEVNLAPTTSKSGNRALCAACGTTLHIGSAFCYACGQMQ